MEREKSQVEQIYEALCNGEELSQGIDAIRRFGSANLRSRICDIEKRYKVKVDRKRVTRDGVSYNKYFLSEFQLNF